MASVAVLGVSSCDKPDTAKDSIPEKVIEVVKETVAEVVSPEVSASLSDEERAAKVGFAKYLPKDTDAFITVYNAEQAAEQLKALKLYGVIESGMENDMMLEEEMDLEIEEVPEEELLEDEPMEAPDAEQELEDKMADDEMVMGEGPNPWTLLGQEVTLAYGESSAEQLGNLLTMSRRVTYFQAKALAQAAQDFLTGGDGMSAAFAVSSGMMGAYLELLNDPESGVGLLDEMNMPPLYIAFRAKEGEVEQAAQMVNQSMGVFAMMPDMAMPVELETGGSSFVGYKLLGEKMAVMMTAQRQGLDEMAGSETVDKIIDAVRKKNLVMVTGSVGDYVVAMIGGSEDSLKLASGVEDSLVATGELNFVDSAADKQLVSLAYGEKKLWEELIEESGGLSTYALGIRDGLTGSEVLGDTRDIQEMLLIIADREGALLDMVSYEDFGMMAFVDQGLKIETFGGMDKGSLAWNEPAKLASLGNNEDNLLFWNSVSTPEYGEKFGEYAEAIFETAYAITMKISTLELPEGDMAEMKQYTSLFDEQFRTDVVGLYEAISGNLVDGLGNESAIVIDLKGVVPAVPDVPKDILENGTMPRITLIMPVEDRSKVSAAWGEINLRATSLLAKAGQITGKEIPMQKPMSSEKEGMTTWFFPFAFFQDDFLPSVTLNDEWFAASTSKLHATDVIKKAAAGGEAGKGMNMYVNFTALNAYATKTLDLVEKNAEEIFKSEFALKDFNRNKAQTREIIAAFDEFESMSWTAQKEDGYVRNTMHFKTKP